MKIEKVLETVFLDKWNTTAIILEKRIVVKLFNGVYMDRKECFDHINENCKGWVQKSQWYREAKKKNEKISIETDPLERFEKLYDDLFIYSKEKFKEFKG